MQHSDFLPASRPVLADLASCDRWLARERITDSDRACAAFIGLLDQLEDAPPSAADRHRRALPAQRADHRLDHSNSRCDNAAGLAS